MANLKWPEDLFLLEPRTVEIYDEESIENIINEFEIPQDKVRRLYNAIDLATQYYLRSIDASENNMSIKDSKIHLERIERLSNELITLLENKANPIWMALRNAEQKLIQELMSVDNPTLESIGAARRVNSDLGEAYEYLTYWDAEAGVRLLQKISNIANDFLRKGKPGRPSNWGIDMWTHVICRYWSDDLGREVTHDEHHGEALTSAGKFLAAVMRPLDESAIPSINWSLSKHRTKIRQLKKNREPSNPD